MKEASTNITSLASEHPDVLSHVSVEVVKDTWKYACGSHIYADNRNLSFTDSQNNSYRNIAAMTLMDGLAKALSDRPTVIAPMAAGVMPPSPFNTRINTVLAWSGAVGAFLKQLLKTPAWQDPRQGSDPTDNRD